MTYQDTVHAARAADQSSGWLVPVIGGGILALLWAAYTLTFLVHIAMMPLPAL